MTQRLLQDYTVSPFDAQERLALVTLLLDLTSLIRTRLRWQVGRTFPMTHPLDYLATTDLRVRS